MKLRRVGCAVGLMWLGGTGCSLFDASEPGAPSDESVNAAVQAGPLPTLLVTQAHFEMKGGKPVPQPAKLVLLRQSGDEWLEEEILDPTSNVFHKAIPWRGGILTIGAMKARLTHWLRRGDEWTPSEVLWERTWGGAFDRLRDLEVGDVDGDGREDLVLATHDQGVIAVGTEVGGTWHFTELGRTADTFVHEIELGDLDGDGALEIYATPSDRNRASLTSQPGAVVRYAWNVQTGQWDATRVAEWEVSHAKEILVTDLGSGHDRLYAAREGHTRRKPDGTLEVLEPVQIVRLDPSETGSWTQTVVASMDDPLCRFLVPGDVDGDGRVEILAAGMKTGLWLLEPRDDGTFGKTRIDADSSGFEHATHVADLDSDGIPEIYVAADDQRRIRRYEWDGEGFDRSDVAEIPPHHITWNIQDGRL